MSDTDDPKSSIISVPLPPTFPTITVACCGRHDFVWAHWLLVRLLPIAETSLPLPCCWWQFHARCPGWPQLLQGLTFGRRLRGLGQLRWTCPMPLQLTQHTLFLHCGAERCVVSAATCCVNSEIGSFSCFTSPDSYSRAATGASSFQHLWSSCALAVLVHHEPSSLEIVNENRYSFSWLLFASRKSSSDTKPSGAMLATISFLAVA